MSEIKTCPGLCCEKVGTLSYNPPEGERVFFSMDMLRALAAGQTIEAIGESSDEDRAWFGWVADSMLEVVDVIDGIEHFTCKLYDRATSMCSIYENRPTLCRNYPREDGCPHCTYDPGKPDIPGALREVAP